MYSVPTEATQSWFVVKAAVALIPVLTFGTADVIAWFLRVARFGGVPRRRLGRKMGRHATNRPVSPLGRQ